MTSPMTDKNPDTMNALKAAKSALRKQMKETLNSLSVEEKKRQSAAVTQKLLDSAAYQSANRLSIFLSMDDEINTGDILQHSLGSGKACFIPRYDSKSRQMAMVLLRSLEDYNSLPETSWRIKQPSLEEERENALQTGGLDLVLVPGLAFTEQGHRLGRGRGYYDTFLSSCLTLQGASPPALIAVAFSQQLVPEVPTENTDILVDTVLTEHSVNAAK